MSSDGKIIIETGLDTKGFEKDVETATGKVADGLGKGTEKAMKQAEKSIKDVGKAVNSIDCSKVTKQMNSISKDIEKTSTQIDKQKEKLTKLKTSLESATNIKDQDKIASQMQKAEASITKLESKLKGLKEKQVDLKVKMDSINDLDGEFHSASVKITKDIDAIEKKSEEAGNKIKKNLNPNVNNKNAFSDIAEGIEKTGKSISEVGSNLTTHVTLPVIGLGAAAAKIGMDFDSGMSRVKAISGATGEEFKSLHDQALQLGADTAFSAKQAAEGMENLASAGFSTNEIMSAMPGLLNLAASSGESLASSSDIAASTLRGFGLAADQTGHVADVLAKNAGATNAAVADTGEAMKYIAPVAHSMGLGLEEVTAAIGEMANSGIKGSQAGTTLRSALTRLASPADEAKKAMKAIGFEAFDSQGKLKPLTGIIDGLSKSLKGKTDQQKQDYIATIFGQEAMSGMLTLIDNGSGSLDNLTNSYKNADGAAADMAKTMQDNSKSSVEQMMGSLETTAIKLEEDFAPIIIEVCNKVQDLANRFSELSPEQQEFYAKLVLGLAVLGPTAKLIGGVTSNVGKFVKVVGALAPLLGGTAGAEAAAAGGLAGFSGALVAMAPVALPVIAAVAALGVGVAAVATANDMLGDKLTRTTDDMTDWQKAINYLTGSTFKSKKELQELGVEYQDFGDNISENFKKRVEESTKTLNEFQLFVGKINLDGIIDDSESNEFTNKVKKMADDSINAIKSKQSESQQALSKMFTLDDNKIDETEKKVIDSISETYDTQINEENKLKDEILAIKKKAVDEKRKLNDQEVKDIQDKMDKIKQIELEQVGGTDEEQEYGKNQFKARVERISAEDAAALLKEKKDELDKQNDDIKASFDTHISLMKRKLSEAKAEDKAAIQEEIDKFTDLRDKKLNLKQDEYNEYIKILQEKNPAALELVDVFNAEMLHKEDKLSQDTLKDMKERYRGLSEITQSGTYKLYNKSKDAMEDVTVTVDAGTQIITGAYSESSDLIGGYTQKMAEDTAELGQAHSQLAIDCQKTADNLAQATIDAKGNIISTSGQTVGALKDIQVENGKVVSGILNINGTPIKIETNADGTIKNIDSVKSAIEGIPKERELAFKILTTGETSILAGYKAMLSGGGGNISYEDYKKNVGAKYTGTSGGSEGLITKDEHGYEFTTGENELYYLGSGTGILDHGSSVNQMKKDVSNAVDNRFSAVISRLLTSLGYQTATLNKVESNTGETAENGAKNIELSEKLATNLINKMNSTGGTFSSLQNELDMAQQSKEKAGNLKAENYSYYASAKKTVDELEGQIDDLNNKIDETTDENVKKQLEADKKVLDKKKDNAQKLEKVAKEAAENEIEQAKNVAEQQVKIAEEKKEKLTKLAEAVTDAIKSQLEEEKAAAEKTLNDEITSLETKYNKKVASIEKSTESKAKDIDEQIKALEQESTDTSREQERQEAKDNINVLKTKMNNTASEADKRSLALQIKDAEKELKAKEDAWDIEDEKAALEDEKNLLSERADNRKKSLEEEYNKEKEAKEKELKATDAYYDKLLQQDSLNAQARYLLLNSNSQELVKLLNSYNPQWQNAGQSLADSLLTGLNSEKQSVEDAVNEMVNIRGQTPPVVGSHVEGYASGTSNNPHSGFYNVDEEGFELADSGNAVAYVSQGAAIKNHMQSEQFIKGEIARQVSMMRASVLEQQANMQSLLAGSIARSSSNSTIKNETNNNAPLFHAENVYLRDENDIEQMAYKLGFYAVRNRTS